MNLKNFKSNCVKIDILKTRVILVAMTWHEVSKLIVLYFIKFDSIYRGANTLANLSSQ